MSGTMEEMAEAGFEILALIERATEEGLEKEEYEQMMEKGLTENQVDVVEKYVGEGRINLTGVRSDEEMDAHTPTLLEKLQEGKKIPWTFELDGVGFVVKTNYGEKRSSHSVWFWYEEGYKFTFYNPNRDSCVYSISIQEVDSN